MRTVFIIKNLLWGLILGVPSPFTWSSELHVLGLLSSMVGLVSSTCLFYRGPRPQSTAISVPVNAFKTAGWGGGGAVVSKSY